MRRPIAYQQEVPFDFDILNTNRNVLKSLGFIIQDVLGAATSVSGLACAPTIVPSLAVSISAGRIYSLQTTDATAYSDIGTDSDLIMKQGILPAAITLNCPAPTSAGQSINYLIEAAYQDSDTAAEVLPYYNALNPASPLAGPGGLGASQATQRDGIVSLIAKAGFAATTGSQVTPAPDSGYVGLWVVTVAFGATTIVSGNIAQAGGAPFIGSFLTQALADARYLQQTGADLRYLQLQARTAAEISAGVTPTSLQFAELDVRRYGAANANTGAQNAVAIQSCISVLARYTGAEMVIQAGLVLNVTQVTFTSMSKFNVRCDGALVATAASPGTAFTNLSANQGVFTPVKFSSCTKFKVYGKGWINNGFVDAVFITGCTDFDWSLDCRGNCTNAVTATGNSTMNGITIVTSNQFRLHDMTVDSVTSQNMNNSTDVFFEWENNIFLSGCTDFELGPSILSRKAGYGAFFVSSNCFDFSIHDNIGELCSGTACTIAFGGGGVVGQRFTVSGNVWRLNQEDAFCVTNQSGTNASINAAITGNVASYTGWCNCSQGTTTPASGGGAALNFQFVDDFSIGDNSSIEHTTSGIALVGCARVSGDVGSVFQQVATGSTVIGISVLSGAQDFKLSGGTISCGGSGAQSLLINGTNADLQFANIAMPAGQISLSGTYSSCKFTGIVAVCSQAVSAPFDFIDCTIGVTTAGQNGIVVGNSNVKLVRTSGGASGGSGIGIVVNGVNDVVLEDCVGTATGTGFGIQVINSSGTNLRGCLGNATSGNAISVTGTCDRLVLIGCKGNSTSGNALNMALSTITNAVLISFRALAGAIVTTGTTFLAGMDVP